jgi:tetratricopeptide (TPR) repeat protein
MSGDDRRRTDRPPQRGGARPGGRPGRNPRGDGGGAPGRRSSSSGSGGGGRYWERGSGGGGGGASRSGGPGGGDAPYWDRGRGGSGSGGSGSGGSGDGRSSGRSGDRRYQDRDGGQGGRGAGAGRSGQGGRYQARDGSGAPGGSGRYQDRDGGQGGRGPGAGRGGQGGRYQARDGAQGGRGPGAGRSGQGGRYQDRDGASRGPGAGRNTQGGRYEDRDGGQGGRGPGAGRSSQGGRYQARDGGRARVGVGRYQDRDRDRDGNRGSGGGGRGPQRGRFPDRDKPQGADGGGRGRGRDDEPWSLEERERRRQAEAAGPKKWGGLARRGAGRLTSGRASEAWREAVDHTRDAAPGDDPDATKVDEPAWQPEEWIDEGELRDEAAEAVGRGTRRPQRSRQRAADVYGADDDEDEEAARAARLHEQQQASGATDLANAVGPARAARAESRLKEASEAFRRERFEDARRVLRPLSEQAPGVAAVRELYGLTLYRLGRWAQAMRELEAYRVLTGGTDQHPVLADTYRALGRYHEVDELWQELKGASPTAELVAEGRIVAAGALADQGRLPEAIELLAAGVRPTKRARIHHLRMAYALADLYERAGDLPRARDLFRRVADTEPEFVDVQARIHALR